MTEPAGPADMLAIFRIGAHGIAVVMDDEPPLPKRELKLGKRTFEKVNESTSEPDPNAVHQILDENRAVDPSFDLPEIDEEIVRLWRVRRRRDLKTFALIGTVDAVCLGLSALAHWSPYATVPLISAGAVITAATLWIVYVLHS